MLHCTVFTNAPVYAFVVNAM